MSKLESLIAQALPVPPALLEKATEILRVRKWKHKYHKLKLSKAVTLKQLEVLNKEGKHPSLMNDKFC